MFYGLSDNQRDLILSILNLHNANLADSHAPGNLIQETTDLIVVFSNPVDPENHMRELAANLGLELVKKATPEPETTAKTEATGPGDNTEKPKGRR